MQISNNVTSSESSTNELQDLGFPCQLSFRLFFFSNLVPVFPEVHDSLANDSIVPFEAVKVS